MGTIGERIKNKRTELGLSAQKVAKLLGTSKENIYKWEGGSTPSDPQVYNKIVNWLENVPQETVDRGQGLILDSNVFERLLEEKEARRQETAQNLEKAHSDKDKILEELSALRKLYEREIERMMTNLDQGQKALHMQIDAATTSVVQQVGALLGPRALQPQPVQPSEEGKGLAGKKPGNDGKGKTRS